MKNTKMLAAVFIGLLLCLIVPALPARAQTGAHISVMPAVTTIDLSVGNTALVQIYVDDVVELNAYEIILVYDPDVLSLTSWSHGGILKNLMNVIPPVNNPGYLQIAVTQIATPGYTGDGVLLNLNFQASAEGSSPITMTKAELARPNGVQLYPTVHNGVFNAVRKFTVSGNISVEYNSLRAGIPVALVGGTALTLVRTLHNGGRQAIISAFPRSCGIPTSSPPPSRAALT